MSKLAAENVALRAAMTEQERKAKFELQDLRKFCIASQERGTSKDSSALDKLQQDQQLLMKCISSIESTAKETIACQSNISKRLDEVHDLEAYPFPA